MALDRMRRWPTYVTAATIFLLFITLLNSWGSESELLNKIEGMAIQLNDCNLKQDWCVAEKDLITNLKDDYIGKARNLERDKTMCNKKTEALNIELENSKSQVNNTLVEVELCKTELEHLKSLQTSKSSVLDTLRLHKKSLTAKVKEYEERIFELESELENLKSNGTLKLVAQNQTVKSSSPSMATSPQSIKSSVDNHPLKEPALENNAKEIVEETNVVEEPFTS